MVQKILVINVPRIFGPAWSVISRLLPQHHKDRIVLLTTYAARFRQGRRLLADGMKVVSRDI